MTWEAAPGGKRRRQRDYCDPDLHDDESAVLDGAAANDRVALSEETGLRRAGRLHSL
jgi:hypothetical protein